MVGVIFEPLEMPTERPPSAEPRPYRTARRSRGVAGAASAGAALDEGVDGQPLEIRVARRESPQGPWLDGDPTVGRR